MYYAAATCAWIEWNLDGSCCGGDVDFNCYDLFFAEPKESLSLLNYDLWFEGGNYWWNIIKRDHVSATNVIKLTLFQQ